MVRLNWRISLIWISMILFSSVNADFSETQNGQKSLELYQNWVFDIEDYDTVYSFQTAYPPSAYPEIICTRGEGCIAIVSSDFGPNGYVQKWISDEFPFEESMNLWVLLEYKKLKEYGFDEILVVKDNAIYLFDRPSRTLKKSKLWSCEIYSACVEDYDKDGFLELILGTQNNGIQFVNLDTLEVECTFSDSELESDSNIGIGQVDDDGSFELVVIRSSYDSGYVLDLDSWSTEWTFSTDDSSFLKLADVDDDGKKELIMMDRHFYENYIEVFDVDKKTSKWSKPVLDLSAIEVVDIEDDGRKEILVGGFNHLYCLDAATGDELWDYSFSESDEIVGQIFKISLDDIDLDGQKEIVMFNSVIYGNTFFVVDSTNMQIEWTGVNPDPPIEAFDVSDIDRDGVNDIVFSSPVKFDSGILVYDGVTHRRKIFHVSDFSDVEQLEICNLIPSSTALEMVVLTDNSLVFSNPVTFETYWKSQYGERISLFTCFDVDTDGANEVIAIGGYFKDPRHVIVYDGATGLKKWESMNICDSVIDLKVADIDNDGTVEIGILTNNGDFYLMSYMSYNNEWELENLDIGDFDFADVYPNIPGREIIFGYTEEEGGETVQILDGINHSMINTFSLDEDEIIKILAVDLDKDGTTELCFAMPNYVICTDLSGNVLWKTSNFDFRVNRIMCCDVNNDDVNEFFIQTDQYVIEYRVGGVSPDPTSDCEESGVRLKISSDNFHSGDVFHLESIVCNASNQVYINYHIFVLLDVYGEFWCAPSWVSSSDGIDYYTYSIPPGGWRFDVIPYFIWPDIDFNASGIGFWSALMNSDMTEIIGELNHVEFGWE